MYTTKGCGFCKRAKALLKEDGVPFEEVDLTGQAEAREELSERTQHFSLPQIFINSSFIGGCCELAELRESLGGLRNVKPELLRGRSVSAQRTERRTHLFSRE